MLCLYHAGPSVSAIKVRLVLHEKNLADIAALALFLCSDKARQIQRTAIAVDGGTTIGYY